MAKLVSQTYGEALVELANELDIASSMLEEIQSVRTILKDNPEFTKLMLHPGIAKQEKLQIVEKVFKGKVRDELTGLISIIVENERFKDIDSIFQYFIDKVKESQGIGVVYVTTPLELSDKEKSNIVARILETTDFKTVEMNYSIDKSLIGGMIIRIGDRYVDSSIRNRLDDLTKELLQIQLG